MNGYSVLMVGPHSKLKTGTLTLFSAILTALAFPSSDLWFLAWFGLVPFLCLVPGLSPRLAFAFGYVWALALYLLLIHWLFPVTAIGATLLILVYSFLPALCFGAQGLLLKRYSYRAWLLFPCLWTAMEYAMATVPVFSFPWCLLADTQHRVIPLVQICSVTGVYGLSFLVCAVNGFLAWGIRQVAGLEKRRPGSSAAGATALAIGLIVITGWGQRRMDRSDTAPPKDRPLRVALLQGNFGHLYKWSGKSREDILQTYALLSAEAGRQSAEFVVWPETAIPLAALDDPVVRPILKDMVAASRAYSLVGSLREPPGDTTGSHYNAAFLIDPEGVPTFQEYYKRHLVPFGEYVPFQKVFFFVDIVSAGASIFKPGREAVVFDLPRQGEKDVQFGVLICYESLFPAMSRQYVRAGADFLVNITNDAWYGKSAMPYQHASLAVFRAVENGVPLLRAANTGLTLWVDPFGRIRRTLKKAGEALFVEGALLAEVPLRRVPTFYSRWGDVFSLACVGLVLLFVVVGFRPGSKAASSEEKRDRVS